MRRRDRSEAGGAREGYWFKQKRFGLGAVPVTWQGWVATLVMIAAAAPVAYLAEHRSPVWLALLVPILGGFMVLCWAKTEGGWRWRWGSRD